MALHTPTCTKRKQVLLDGIRKSESIVICMCVCVSAYLFCLTLYVKLKKEFTVYCLGTFKKSFKYIMILNTYAMLYKYMMLYKCIKLNLVFVLSLKFHSNYSLITDY